MRRRSGPLSLLAVSRLIPFLTTHYLDEADALADRIVVVDAGRIVAEGTSAELKRRYVGDPAASLQDAFLAITSRATADEPLAI